MLLRVNTINDSTKLLQTISIPNRIHMDSFSFNKLTLIFYTFVSVSVFVFMCICVSLCVSLYVRACVSVCVREKYTCKVAKKNMLLTA